MRQYDLINAVYTCTHSMPAGYEVLRATFTVGDNYRTFDSAKIVGESVKTLGDVHRLIQEDYLLVENHEPMALEAYKLARQQEQLYAYVQRIQKRIHESDNHHIIEDHRKEKGTALNNLRNVERGLMFMQLYFKEKLDAEFYAELKGFFQFHYNQPRTPQTDSQE